jgi:hypothetical protein
MPTPAAQKSPPPAPPTIGSAPPSALTPVSPWRLGLAGARANIVPGICLQIFALAILGAYYLHAPSRAALERIATFRIEVGVPFDAVSTALFGAVIPFLVLKLRPSSRARYNLPQMAVITAFWAYKGVEVSYFYKFQAWLFGEGHSATTIVLKTLADQYVYCPIVAIPVTWLVYTWAEHRFDSEHIVAEVGRPKFYTRCVLPVLIANWGIWTPAVAIIYLLPTALQLPMQNIVLCFFTLLLATITRRPPP